MIVAHLNGGPADGTELALSGPVDAMVARVLNPAIFLGTSATPAIPPFLVGRYIPQRDDLGQMIPHSLNAYDYIWTGWT